MDYVYDMFLDLEKQLRGGQSSFLFLIIAISFSFTIMVLTECVFKVPRTWLHGAVLPQTFYCRDNRPCSQSNVQQYKLCRLAILQRYNHIY